MSRIKIKAICKNCNKDFYPHRTSFGIYCSNRCQKEFARLAVIQQWLAGEINPINTNGLLRPWARLYVFKINNSKCMICGWNKINKSTNLIPLEIDHIDGNYRNNILSNLRLLCPNCHSLTSTYKNSNKGNGRNNRLSKVIK